MELEHERESVVETHLVKQTTVRSGLAPKYKSPQRNNVPDRQLFLPMAFFRFAELKETGEEPTDAQYREHERLRKLGFVVLVFDHKSKVDKWYKWYDNLMDELNSYHTENIINAILSAEPHISNYKKICKP
jgi:hypothetical protein